MHFTLEHLACKSDQTLLMHIIIVNARICLTTATTTNLLIFYQWKYM